MDRNSIIEILKSNNLKTTPKRIEILSIFFESNFPLCAEDIFFILNTRKCDINLATIYRILLTFSQNKIIQVSSIIGRKAYYTLTSSNHSHYFICLKCNNKSPIDTCYINQIESKLEKYNRKVISHHFEVYGICENCGGLDDEKKDN